MNLMKINNKISLIDSKIGSYSIISINDFMKLALSDYYSLSVVDKELLIEKSIFLLDNLYVHKFLKKTVYGVSPIGKLNILKRNIPYISSHEFNKRLFKIFIRFRDRHSQYMLPRPYKGATAFLPFSIEEYHDDAHGRSYLVTSIHEEIVDQLPDSFRKGAVITHWNGMTISKAIFNYAENDAGGNIAAHRLRSLSKLTSRPLGSSLLPDEDWINITYTDDSHQHYDICFRWNILISTYTIDNFNAFDMEEKQEKNQQPPEDDSLNSDEKKSLGMDFSVENNNAMRSYVCYSSSAEKHDHDDGSSDVNIIHCPDISNKVFVCNKVIVDNKEYSYIKIRTFNISSNKFRSQLEKILSSISSNKIIIDVRDNPGGVIDNVSILLNNITTKKIVPLNFSFINSEATEKITENNYKQWNQSIQLSNLTGAVYSSNFPLRDEQASLLLSPDDNKSSGNLSVVLLTNALSYSATDMLAVTFKDNNIGKIIGVDENIGAGGANVWSYSQIKDLLAFDDKYKNILKPLPQGADIIIAVRRAIRSTGKRIGLPIEDFGLMIDLVYKRKKEDLMHNDIHLLRYASEVLEENLQGANFIDEHSEIDVMQHDYLVSPEK